MRKHATEDVFEPALTLCGADVERVLVDNAAPDCGRCKRVIRSRCSVHNCTRCKACPRALNIGAR